MNINFEKKNNCLIGKCIFYKGNVIENIYLSIYLFQDYFKFKSIMAMTTNFIIREVFQKEVRLIKDISEVIGIKTIFSITF